MADNNNNNNKRRSRDALLLSSSGAGGGQKHGEGFSLLPVALQAGRVPRFVVDLDQSPETRWDAVVDVYGAKMREIDAQLGGLQTELGVSNRTSSMLQMFAGAAMKMSEGRREFNAEIEGIARRSGIAAGRLVLMQLLYEASACCTAFVVPYAEAAPPAADQSSSAGAAGDGAAAPDSQGEHQQQQTPRSRGKPPVHARTMDWGMDFLRDMTIEVDFRRGDETLFLATTWPGYVGVFTGMRPSAYSVSINFRVSGDSYLKNIKAGARAAYPTGLLIRRTLTTKTTFAEATARFESKPLIAPTYIVVCGVERSEATLITRDRAGEASTAPAAQKMEESNGHAPAKGHLRQVASADTAGRTVGLHGNPVELSPHSEAQRRRTLWVMSRDGPICQANTDHWSHRAEEDILWSFKRVALGRKRIEESAGRGFEDRELWSIMSEQPILNELTIYGTIMCPRFNVFMTRVPLGAEGFDHDSPTAHIFDSSEALGQELTSESHRLRMCARCFVPFSRADNPGGKCVHVGKWHQQWADCSKINCAWNLKTRLGNQHWDCCWSTHAEGTCIRSPPHEEATTAPGTL